jgi:hypothetical protein
MEKSQVNTQRLQVVYTNPLSKQQREQKTRTLLLAFLDSVNELAQRYEREQRPALVRSDEA